MRIFVLSFKDPPIPNATSPPEGLAVSTILGVQFDFAIRTMPVWDLGISELLSPQANTQEKSTGLRGLKAPSPCRCLC